MTRIIAGFAGSLTLKVPPVGTRPTSDRVREALFSALEARDVLAGARVLDLYAGSGALGLEAASRGASAVTLVERGAAAAKACTENAARVRKAAAAGAEPELRVAASAVQSFLSSARGPWDLVFLDPPYELGHAELGTGLETLLPLLVPAAVVIVERAARSAFEPPPGYLADRRSAYGDTALHWLSVAPHHPAEAASVPGASPSAR